MSEFEKIIDRLRTARVAYDRVRQAALLSGGPLRGPEFDATQAEYTRAWDASSLIWDAAEDATNVGKHEDALRLWGMLVPYDNDSSERITALLDMLDFEQREAADALDDRRYDRA